MHKKFVRFSDINTILSFVKFAEGIKGKVIVSRNNFMVNGKSLLGVLSLDLEKGVEVQYPERAKEFENYLSLFEIKK